VTAAAADHSADGAYCHKPRDLSYELAHMGDDTWVWQTTDGIITEL